MAKSFDVLALGEILLRLSPPRNERMVRGEMLEKQVGGAELNVVSGISILGLRTGIISKIPAHDIGVFAKNRVRFVGVSDDYLVYDEEKDARLGIYYYENGSFPRKPRIVYDRLHSSFTKIDISDFSDEMFKSTRCFHTTGISLALCPQSKKTTIEMMKRFKAGGAKISFDVNFRNNLWTNEQAKKDIEEILPYVDIFFCSADSARLSFQKQGDLKSMMKSFTEEYPISIVASTNRVVHSPKVHSFGSIIYDKKSDTFFEEPSYENIEVVDRIGSGDAYISGVLFGLLNYDWDCEKALQFGNATSAIKNTIPGDMQASGINEILQIIQEHEKTGCGFEMMR